MKKAMIVAALVALALATTAFAATGGGAAKGSSSIDLVLVNTAGVTAAATASPSYGDPITFAVSTTATQYPYVNLLCYQNGALVAEGWTGFFEGALGNQTFRLYSPQWTGGEADCTAWLDMNSHGRWKQLASTSFHVNA
jgi:hypothetical protein